MEWANLWIAGVCAVTGLIVGFGLGKAWGSNLGWHRGYHAARAFYALKVRHEQQQPNTRL